MKQLKDYLFYSDDWTTIYCGDCKEILPMLEPMDVLITDPPYGVEFTGKVNRNKVHFDGYADKIGDNEQYTDTVVIPSILMALSLTKRGAVFPGVRNLFKYPKPDDIGAFFVQYGGGVGKWGFSSVNLILYYGKDPFLQKRLGSHPNSWLVNEIAEKNGHPCPKPIGWINKLVSRVSFIGETILDPFLGSGTTCVAAKNENRKSVGIEINPKYCEIAVKRLRQEVLDFRKVKENGIVQPISKVDNDLTEGDDIWVS